MHNIKMNNSFACPLNGVNYWPKTVHLQKFIVVCIQQIILFNQTVE